MKTDKVESLLIDREIFSYYILSNDNCILMLHLSVTSN